MQERPRTRTSRSAAKPPAVPLHPTTHRTADRLENRLFARMQEGNPWLESSNFQPLAMLKAKLPDLGRAIAELQRTRTGYAIRPLSDDADISGYIPALLNTLQTTVEKASNLVSYRLCLVPRKIGTLTDDLQPTTSEVSPEMLISELEQALGHQASMAQQTKSSLEPTHSNDTTWIVRFHAETPKLPRGTQLFGFWTTLSLLKERVAVVQCERCHMWHNGRMYNRPLRCKQYGSTEHASHNHPAHVVPKCIQCHGPHSADYEGCLLRKKKDRTFTKAQQAAIRHSGAASRLMFESSLKAKINADNAAAAAATVAAGAKTSPEPRTVDTDMVDEPTTPKASAAQTAPFSTPPRVTDSVVASTRTRDFFSPEPASPSRGSRISLTQQFTQGSNPYASLSNLPEEL